MIYMDFSCSEISHEAQRLSQRAALAAGEQDRKSTNDAVATGVAVVLFWPAAFLIKGDGAASTEVARLKGEMDAIEQASHMKRCGIAFPRSAAR